MKNIEIYTGPGCSQCEQAKSLLRQHGFEFDERDVTEPKVLSEFRERMPRQKALPQIFIDGRHIGGLQDLRICLAGET